MTLSRRWLPMTLATTPLSAVHRRRTLDVRLSSTLPASDALDQREEPPLMHTVSTLTGIHRLSSHTVARSQRRPPG